MKKIFKRIQHVFFRIGNLLFWLIPLALFLIATCLPKIIWNPSFKDYLNFLKILIWPYTALTILFFFKEVTTYLFFSMNEFNFFGAKGNLKNVNEVILEAANRKFLDEKSEERRKVEINSMSLKIEEKETEIKMAKGSATENLDLAKDIFRQLKSSEKEFKAIISDLEKENKRLKDMVSGLPQDIKDNNASPDFYESAKTDDLALEANSK